MSLLHEATRNADLQDPFVEIVDLGDFAITYRAAGVLTEVKELEKQLKDCDETSRPDLEQRIARLRRQLEEISTALTAAEKNVDENAD
jgi:hypothetical protein